MVDSRRITLVHEGFLIASWSSKFQSVSLREAKIHVPSLFEPGSYKMMIAGEELVDYVLVDTHASVVLTIVPTSLRVSVTLRNMSGEQLMVWPECAPYHRLGDLGIPGIRKSYTILKQGQILDDHHRMWLEDEPHAVELTMIIILESYFVFHLYMHVGGPGEYTAVSAPWFLGPCPCLNRQNQIANRDSSAQYALTGGRRRLRETCRSDVPGWHHGEKGHPA